MFHFKWNLISITTLFILSAPVSAVMAWDNETTHRDLSAEALSQSQLKDDAGSLVINYFGISQGTNAILHWNDGRKKKTDKKIFEWIEDGAIFEDEGSKPLNHFHNPLKQSPWTNAGLDDIFFVHVTGESALLWAQDDTNNPYWSWQATRRHYLNALTKSLKEDRDSELAQTFVGIGHLIHLVQDMSHNQPMSGMMHIRKIPMECNSGDTILN